MAPATVEYTRMRPSKANRVRKRSKGKVARVAMPPDNAFGLIVDLANREVKPCQVDPTSTEERAAVAIDTLYINSLIGDRHYSRAIYTNESR